jgi:hypothetical protein
VTFARTFANAGKDRDAVIALHHRVDEFHYHDRLADARAAEHRRFAALGERREEVDHLDAGLEHCRRWTAIGQRWGRSVDRRARHILRQRRATVADIAGHIEQPAQRRRPGS